MSRNNVRGPNSALTEFLRSRGIRVENTRNRRAQDGTPALSTENTANSEEPPVTEQEQLDAQVAEELAARLENERPRSASKRSATKKKRKRGEEDEAYDPEDEPDHGRSGFTRGDRPANGHIDFCAECNCRFTVTSYNKSNEKGLLCSACGSLETGKKTAAKAKPKAAIRKKRAKAVLDGETTKVPRLQDLLIRTIAQHINDIEDFGDIGHVNMDKICQIISKNRALTSDTFSLFLDADLESLTLYDCAKLKAENLTRVAQMCPHLRSLRLHMVGQITDNVLQFYATHLSNLKSLVLRGCFLITLSGWAKFFETVGTRLEVLEISHSARFKEETAGLLVKFCPNLKELTLSKLTHFDDAALIHLAGLKCLKRLDISHPGSAVSNDTIETVLSSIGNSLEYLDLSGSRELTDVVLQESIAKHCTHLLHLKLEELDLLTDAGVAAFFEGWQNPPLLTLSFERCPLIADAGLAAILKHSGINLRAFNINSLDVITNEGIARIAESNALPQVEELDISWVRAVDDTVVRRLLANSAALKKLLVWGNNRVTEFETSANCLIVGRETI